MKKKGQEQIVTTILMILIVLAAIIIVWQVIDRFVRGGSAQIETKMSCIDVRLDIVSANNNTGSVTVTRLSGGADDAVKDVKFLVDGIASDYTGVAAGAGLGVLESEEYTVANAIGAVGKKVQVGAVLKDDTVCDVSSEELTSAV